jgi:hypothetical protein
MWAQATFPGRPLGQNGPCADWSWGVEHVLLELLWRASAACVRHVQPTRLGSITASTSLQRREGASIVDGPAHR